jgi:hypothetical protein
VGAELEADRVVVVVENEREEMDGRDCEVDGEGEEVDDIWAVALAAASALRFFRTFSRKNSPA